jgi:hypothetical protein
VLSGLKDYLLNKILTQNFSKYKIFKTEDNVPAGKFIRGADPNPELDLHQNVTDPQHWHQLTHMINLLIHSQWVNPI